MEEAAPGPGEKWRCEEGWRHEWPGAPGWAARSARLGPLRYSDLGPRRLSPPAPVDRLALWLVDVVDGWWDDAGRPDPYVLVVVSGDDGTLARAVLGLGPACLTALRYVIVDPEAGLPAGEARARAASALVALEEPAFLFPTGRPAGDDLDRDAAAHPDDPVPDPDEPFPPARRVGPLVTRLWGLPVISDLAGLAGPGPAGAVVAIGAVSRLPYDLLEMGPGSAWSEVRVTEDVATAGDGLSEVVVALDRDRLAALPPALREAIGDTPGGVTARPGPLPTRRAVLVAAARWLRDALGSAPAGFVAIVDRWDGTSEPDSPAGASPALAFDQLGRIRAPAGSSPEPLFDGLAVVVWRSDRG